MRKKLAFLTLVAVLFAVLHACSLNNNILIPDCQVFEVEMVDKWWYPTESGAKAQDRLYFTSQGQIQQLTVTDSVTFSINNCNALHIKNHDTGEMDQWNIIDLKPTDMVLEANGTRRAYSTTRPE